ncbi:unnamed protein product [Soboliphyme baturini]|uniref:Transcriptional regulator n=1 Tax=Soboliphyme baturini TaxID=241478 RepID=A0A183IJ60_9BILA|nr:unnamed protein product [Soboliphyme baturini]
MSIIKAECMSGREDRSERFDSFGGQLPVTREFGAILKARRQMRCQQQIPPKRGLTAWRSSHTNAETLRPRALLGIVMRLFTFVRLGFSRDD